MPFFYQSRAAWGARPPKSVRPITRPVQALILHHTVTATGPDEAAILRQVQNFHMDTKGWQDVAYSWLVGQSGTIYQGRGWGVVGGHTDGWNDQAHAVCFIGNSDTDAPSPAALASILAVKAESAALYGGHVTTRLHGDVNQTGCPGGRLRYWYNQGMPAPGGPVNDGILRMEADVRKAFDDVIGRLDGSHTALAKDTNNWVKNVYAVAAGIQSGGAVDIGTDDLAAIAKAVNDELARRQAQ
jgi:hypothetical protein